AALEARSRDREAVAFAFDLLALDGEDLRRRPWIERRTALAKLIGRKPTAGLAFNDHFAKPSPARLGPRLRSGEHCSPAVQLAPTVRVIVPERRGPRRPESPVG